ncbi:MAG TPA: hypothetical protein PLF16_02405 [Candidatus Staskawiczbacteria bacterium]|nr:hypothetical protein [Candidatus Staskawiczbacteria bacterium]
MAVKLSSIFFWLEPLKRIVWESFGWVIIFLFILWVPFLRVWWWVFLPVMLASRLRELYLWWINWDYGYANLKWVMLEITPPQENLVPMKAMEDVLAMSWTVYDGANWKNIWIEGELGYSPYWLSWEIVSTEGKLHFYLRVPAPNRQTLETSLYAHYPNIEIREVADYTRLIPPTIPNDEWDFYGEDYISKREDAYPIKTYEKFFEPQGEKISAEEKRIDPIISLLETLSRLGPGENFWVQFITSPTTLGEEPGYEEEVKTIVAKIAKRPIKKKVSLWEELVYWIREIVMGPFKEGESYTWEAMPAAKTESGEKELLLTPGERELITEIENKAKKPIFRTTIRGVYVAKRENFKSSNKILLRSYFAHFAASNMNNIQLNPPTRPKVNYLMRERRIFLRARKMFRMTTTRLTPAFPDRIKYTSIFNTEELATMFHFPLRVSGMLAPTLEKVESKKAGPPPNLPVG